MSLWPLIHFDLRRVLQLPKQVPYSRHLNQLLR